MPSHATWQLQLATTFWEAEQSAPRTSLDAGKPGRRGPRQDERCAAVTRVHDDEGPAAGVSSKCMHGDARQGNAAQKLPAGEGDDDELIRALRPHDEVPVEHGEGAACEGTSCSLQRALGGKGHRTGNGAWQVQCPVTRPAGRA